MRQRSHTTSQRHARSRQVKGGTVGLLIFFVSAAGLLFCLVRLASESPGATLTVRGSPPSEWTSYFQRGRYLADLRTTMNLVKYLFAPEVVLAGSTNIVHG